VAAAPTRRRPGFREAYGIAAEESGMLDWSFAAERLVAARNYWVATACEDGRPHAMPVWGLWLDGAFVFGTSSRSRKARNLRHDPRAVVHLESGDEVVIVEGVAEPRPLDEPLRDLYEAKYDFRPEPDAGGEGWFRIVPEVAYAWTEREYPRTATRFDFRA
jgi:hypothetical protein